MITGDNRFQLINVRVRLMSSKKNQKGQKTDASKPKMTTGLKDCMFHARGEEECPMAFGTMAGGKRAEKAMFLKTIRTLRNLGNTDDEIWQALSPFDELVPAQFAQAMKKHGISISELEVVGFWKRADLDCVSMKLESFSKFMQSTSQRSAGDPISSFAVFVRSLYDLRTQLIMRFTQVDHTASGYISGKLIGDIVLALRPSSTPAEITWVTERYDTSRDGEVNYFMLLSYIVSYAQTE